MYRKELFDIADEICIIRAKIKSNGELIEKLNTSCAISAGHHEHEDLTNVYFYELTAEQKTAMKDVFDKMIEEDCRKLAEKLGVYYKRGLHDTW